MCSMCSRIGPAVDWWLQGHAAVVQVLAVNRLELLVLREHAAHPHGGAGHAPEYAGNRCIRGIASGADPDEAVQMGQPGRVEHDPAAADEALEAGVEIRRLQLVCIA